jgi:hypothetical protein
VHQRLAAIQTLAVDGLNELLDERRRLVGALRQNVSPQPSAAAEKQRASQCATQRDYP